MSSSNPLSVFPMESHTTIPSRPKSTKTEPTEFDKNQKRYQDLIATFPHPKGWRPKVSLVEYSGYWFVPPLLEGCLHAQEFFQALVGTEKSN
ncbi:Cytosolic sulfotransferase 18 [Cardamine amara subsp. amara]|uniref:Cytosolic sulfotransferase 18 n=1 Tax=Cardamine amara subsp. amara TaxID=228776 RepID=A0ABD0ZP54_CARAN